MSRKPSSTTRCDRGGKKKKKKKKEKRKKKRKEDACTVVTIFDNSIIGGYPIRKDNKDRL